MEPNKSTADGELHQVGCTRVQYFTSPAIPVLPGASLEPRRGRPVRSGNDQQQAAESLVNGSASTQTEVSMDTSRWQKGQEFPLLDLIAELQFKSASSLSFWLGTRGDALQRPDMAEPLVTGPGLVFSVLGWVDVHYPCEGHIKVRIRIGLPDKYLESKQMRDLVQQLFEQLKIPVDETYEADFVVPSKQVNIDQPWDRHGMTDRLY